MEKKIQADLFDNIASNGDNMRVIELVEKYVSTKTTVRRSTKTGYKTVKNVLKNDPMGNAKSGEFKPNSKTLHKSRIFGLLTTFNKI